MLDSQYYQKHVACRAFQKEAHELAAKYEGRVPQAWVDAVHNVLDVTEKRD